MAGIATHMIGYAGQNLSVAETQEVIAGLYDASKEGEIGDSVTLLCPQDPELLEKARRIADNVVGSIGIEVIESSLLPLEGDREQVERGVEATIQRAFGEWATKDQKIRQAVIINSQESTARLFKTNPKNIHPGKLNRIGEPISESADSDSGKDIIILNRAVPTEHSELPPIKDYSGEIPDEERF